MHIPEAAQEVVRQQALGFVATVNADGTPNLSPKGTTTVWDDEHLVFAHLHSPGTVANIEDGRPRVEVNVVDPIVRKGYRFRGDARVLRRGDTFDEVVAGYVADRGLDRSRIEAIVLVAVDDVSELVSPAYDDGASEEEVAARFLRAAGLRRERRQDLPTRDEVIERTHHLQHAVKERDLATLRSLLGDGFTLTTGRPGHEVRTRDEWLEVTATTYRVEEFTFDEIVVQVHEGCAIVRSRYRQRATMGDEDRDGAYRMTDVWVHDGTGWRLEARHAQPLADV